MKKNIFIPLLAIGLLATSCCSTKKAAQNPTEKNQTITVSGEVTLIENGKDGYMATIVDANGMENIATISIVNLNKSGGKFKRYNVGDKVTVKGTSWKDGEKKTYITVSELK